VARVNDDYTGISVEAARTDGGSIRHHYRRPVDLLCPEKRPFRPYEAAVYRC